MKALIVGLGNPGRLYEKTRHNVGFAALDFFAEKQALRFSDKMSFRSSLAEGDFQGEKVALLKPLTFMNLSGEAIQIAVDYWKIVMSNLLVIVDDIDIPFGELRLKAGGGPGTHNGLRNIEACLHTNRYPRLRIGIGQAREGNLESFVLGKFSPEEEKELPKIFEKVDQTIEIWLTHGLNRAMNFANTNRV